MKKLTYFLSAAAVALSLTSCSEDMMEMSTESTYNLSEYQNGSIERIGDTRGPQIGEELIIQLEDRVNALEFQAHVQIQEIRTVPNGIVLMAIGETRYGGVNDVIDLNIFIKDDNVQSKKKVEISFDQLTAKENRSLYFYDFNQAGALE